VRAAGPEAPPYRGISGKMPLLLLREHGFTLRGVVSRDDYICDRDHHETDFAIIDQGSRLDYCADCMRRAVAAATLPGAVEGDVEEADVAEGVAGEGDAHADLAFAEEADGRQYVADGADEERGECHSR